MAVDQETPRSRRSILAAAATGAAAIAVGSLARPLQVQAATGDAILAGNATAADAQTTLTTTTGVTPDVVALAAIGAGLGSGVMGASPRGGGVVGITGDTNVGPYGANDVGVSGRAIGPDAFAGVSGDSDAGYGVLGTAGGVGVLGTAGGVVGVLANGFDLTATSLYAVSSTYPLPAPAPNTAAHVRRSVTATGHALFVDGRLRLKWSGGVAVGAGAAAKKVTVAGMTATTMVFAMFQTNESGVWIRAAIPAAGSVTFAFSKALPTSAVLAWMALG